MERSGGHRLVIDPIELLVSPALFARILPHRQASRRWVGVKGEMKP